MTKIVLRGDGLFCGNDLVSNFMVPEVSPLYSAQDLKNLVGIELKVQAPDGVHPVFANIKLSITSQILTAVPSCRLIDTGAADLVDAYLIEQASQAGGKRVLCNEFGLQRLYNGRWVFIAGDEILGDCGTTDAVISDGVSKVRLAWNRETNERRAICRLLKAIEVNQWTVWPVFMHFLLSSLRSQVFGTGLTTFPVLYLVGLQNSVSAQ